MGPNRRTQERERAAARAAAEAKRAEAERKAIAEAEKIVAIWNAGRPVGVLDLSHVFPAFPVGFDFFARQVNSRSGLLELVVGSSREGTSLCGGQRIRDRN